jgi:hypothetical protein
MNTTNPKAAALTTLMASIRNAVRNRQTTTIGGGNFTYVELQTAAECIEEILAVPVAQPTAIDALRAAETALAVACSFRVVTERHGTMLHAALEGARNVLSDHYSGKLPPGRDALADFGAVVLDQLGNLGAFEDDRHALFDVLVREAEKHRLGTVDRDGTLVAREELPLKPPLHRLDDRELGAVLAGLRTLQAGIENGLTEGVQDVMTDGGTVEPLDVEEIDDLCVRLNMEGA